MKKYDIIFYINAISKGGAEKVFLSLVEHFAAQNKSSLLVNSYKAKNEYPVPYGVDRVVLEENESPNIFLRNIKRIWHLRNICKKSNAQIVLSFMGESNLRCIVATRGLTCKTIISVRNDPERAYNSLFMRVVVSILYPLADGIVLQSKGAKTWFSKAIQRKSVIIGNPIDELFFDNSISSRRRDIVTMGRLVPIKNQKLLVQAFARISKKISDNLYIYGEGPLRIELQNLITMYGLENRIFLPGNINDVKEVAKDAKLFVLTSDSEGLPSSLLEAMAMGLPCISTNCPCGGPAEVIRDGENGVLVPVGDMKALAEKMELLLKDDALCIKYGNEARKDVEKYKSENVFSTWDSYIKQLNGRRGKR